MINNHKALIHQFYTAFQQKDAAGMHACYHEQLRFSDPVFQNLNYQQACDMWAMLIQRGKDLELSFNAIQATEKMGSAHWLATYTFSQTGRKVVNSINAQFEFQDGKIIRHTDQFDLYKWARQAFGLTGTLIGWTPFFQNKVRTMARKGLERYATKT